MHPDFRGSHTSARPYPNLFEAESQGQASPGDNPAAQSWPVQHLFRSPYVPECLWSKLASYPWTWPVLKRAEDLFSDSPRSASRFNAHKAPMVHREGSNKEASDTLVLPTLKGNNNETGQCALGLALRPERRRKLPVILHQRVGPCGQNLTGVFGASTNGLPEKTWLRRAES